MKIVPSYLTKEARERVKDFKRFQKEGLICKDGQFFPSVHYPPITMYKPITEENLFATYQNPKDGLFDIYVHIPFCIKQCDFCHYPVKARASSKEKELYLNMLEKEMDLYAERLQLTRIKARSILVGGGTPTFLAPSQLEAFLSSFVQRIDLAQCTQFSYDVDPTTLLGPEGAARLKILRSHGVGRLTIGVQSFDDGILKRMNRPHDVKDALEAIERAKKYGFKINIEFIFGYPGQTIKQWLETLEKAVGSDVDEIQLYRLKISPYGDKTAPLKKKFLKNPDDFLSVEDSIAMKEVAISFLAKKCYDENLTRVFSKTPQDFSHYADNQCCGLLDEIGFGLTAFSSLRDRFGLNTMDFARYYSMIDEGRLPVDRGLVRSFDDQARQCFILPLKNRKVYKKYYKNMAGISLNDAFAKKIANLKDFGLLEEDDKSVSLTFLGRFFADEVCQQFHHPKYMPFPESAYADGVLNPYRDNGNLVAQKIVRLN